MSTTEIILAVLVGTLFVARLTRLVVDDDFPPMNWLRSWYVRHSNADWGGLVACPFCISFWIAVVTTLVSWLSLNGDGRLDWWWWAGTTPFAAAYVAAMIVVRDLPPSDR